MEELYIMQRAILVGVNLNDPHFDQSMAELERLVQACDIEVVGALVQNLEKISLATYVGSGKVSEILSLVRQSDADIVIFNDELSPSQIRNISKTRLDTQIMDRTALILKFCAARQNPRGQLQVEVAPLQYMMPRLIGLRQSLEQQTGGVGTTNPWLR